MSPTDRHDSILIHPALAGRTLVVRHGGSWAAFEIQPEGELGNGRLVDSDPTTLAWRGGPAR
jgi:hypothetical protein